MPNVSLSIKHFPQEAEAGCLAACAQMALAHLGVTVSQRDLNDWLGLGKAGVPFSRLNALERVGVKVAFHEGTESALQAALDRGVPPIIFVETGQLTSYWKMASPHAVVVVGYDGNDFLLNDPGFSSAPQRVHADELLLAWVEFDYTYALIER